MVTTGAFLLPRCGDYNIIMTIAIHGHNIILCASVKVYVATVIIRTKYINGRAGRGVCGENRDRNE